MVAAQFGDSGEEPLQTGMVYMHGLGRTQDVHS